jgi:hypothetical protein
MGDERQENVPSPVDIGFSSDSEPN